MAKSPDAFRTISEVADWLGVQAHVLRFWESKFTQVKPVKRAGGRRYYRPADMMLLGGIKKLLHEDGLTIKGVQKILREEGMSHVSAMSPPLDEATLQQIGDDLKAAPAPEPVELATPETPVEPTGVVLSFDSAKETAPAPPEPAPQPQAVETSLETPTAEAEPASEEAPAAAATEVPEPSAPQAAEAAPADAEAPAASSAAPAPPAPQPPAETAAEAPAPAAPSEAERQSAAIPDFLRHPAPASADAPPAAAAAAAPAASRPRNIPTPSITPEDQIHVAPALLSAAFRASSLSASAAQAATPLLARLTALRDSMAAQRGGAKNSPTNR